MNEATHTPGPWDIGEPIDDINRNGRVFIWDYSGTVYIGEACASDVGGEEANANAMLFAAAPDLLAELVKVRDLYYEALKGSFSETFIDGISMVNIEGAIDKAKGGAA